MRKRYVILVNFLDSVDIYKDINCKKFITRYTKWWFWNEVFMKDKYYYIPLSSPGVIYNGNNS